MPRYEHSTCVVCGKNLERDLLHDATGKWYHSLSGPPADGHQPVRSGVWRRVEPTVLVFREYQRTATVSLDDEPTGHWFIDVELEGGRTVQDHRDDEYGARDRAEEIIYLTDRADV